MDIIDRSLQLRLKLTRLLDAWLRPHKLLVEAEREALNAELRRHWPERAFAVQELIREEWESETDSKAAGAGPGRLQYLVFIDSEETIDWFTDGNLDPDNGRCVAAAEAVGARRCKHLPREQRLEFRRLVGLAIVEGIRGNRDESVRLAKEAAAFLMERTVERSRCWTLSAAHALVMLFAVGLWSVWHLGRPLFGMHADGVLSLFLSVQGGMAGAYLSVVQKTGKGAWDAASGLGMHVLEVFTKILAGCLCGGIAFALSRSVHAPPSIRELTSDPFSLIVFGFAAGLFERAIPRMVSAYVDRDTAKGSPDP